MNCQTANTRDLHARNKVGRRPQADDGLLSSSEGAGALSPADVIFEPRPPKPLSFPKDTAREESKGPSIPPSAGLRVAC